VNAEDKLAQAVSDWQRKYRIADDDPMMATLELVRIYLHEVRRIDNESAPPSFDDFRGTIELLDRRSKAFIHQATDLAAELRHFGQNVRRINQTRLVTQLTLTALSIVAGFLIARLV
jgi:hypothetical protein